MKQTAAIMAILALSGCYENYYRADKQVRFMAQNCVESTMLTTHQSDGKTYTTTITCTLKELD